LRQIADLLESHIRELEEKMTFLEAMEALGRDDRYRATVYAMNTLLVQKGIYTPAQFERCFTEWTQKHAVRELERGE
jgi:hypothetical protein